MNLAEHRAMNADAVVSHVQEMGEQLVRETQRVDNLIDRLVIAAEAIATAQKDATGARKSAQRFCKERNSLQEQVASLVDLVKRLQKELYEEARRPIYNWAQGYVDYTISRVCLEAEVQNYCRTDVLEHDFATDRSTYLRRFVRFEPKTRRIEFALMEKLSDRSIDAFVQEVAALATDKITSSLKEQLQGLRASVSPAGQSSYRP